MVEAVTVKKSSEVIDCEGNVWACTNRHVHQPSDQRTVRSFCKAVDIELGRLWVIRDAVAQAQDSLHGRWGRMSIRLVELGD
jgi:hypothetical protein